MKATVISSCRCISRLTAFLLWQKRAGRCWVRCFGCCGSSRHLFLHRQNTCKLSCAELLPCSGTQSRSALGRSAAKFLIASFLSVQGEKWSFVPNVTVLHQIMISSQWELAVWVFWCLSDSNLTDSSCLFLGDGRCQIHAEFFIFCVIFVKISFRVFFF